MKMTEKSIPDRPPAKAEMTLDKEKKKGKSMDITINSNESFELNLNEEESEKIIASLKRGPNEKAKNFLKEARIFYEEMKKKEELFKKNDFL